MSAHQRSASAEARARAKVISAAVGFWKDPESQDAMEQLKGTESAAAPAAFMLLMEAVEDYKRPAIARLKEFVRENTPRDRNLRG